MRVLIVSGIWSPDVGGPASHAPELAAYLRRRGHEVGVVTTADREPAAEAYRVDWVSRRIPVGIRHLAVAEKIRSRARSADVVYATSMVGRAAPGAVLARRPLVVRIAGDVAYERALRRGYFRGDLEAFQRWDGGVRVATLRRERDAALRCARRILCPSAYLGRFVVGWGIPEAKVVVIPNPAPQVVPTPPREQLRARLGMSGRTLAFAGRLTTAKALDVALKALAAVPDITLLIGGDGPEESSLRKTADELGLTGRVRFLGPLARDEVLELFLAADAMLLPSAWENFPHTVVESLAVGTPVIATRVGGVPEVVCDRVNGLLVAPRDPEAMAAAIARLFDEPGLRDRLAAAAAPSVRELERDTTLARIESLLRDVVAA